MIAWLASIVELELGIFFLVCAICFTIRNLLVFTTNRNAYLQAIKAIIEKRWMHAKAVGRAKRRMEGFSPTSISPRMQVELSRRMLEDMERDIEQVFTQNVAQPAHTANGRTHVTA